MKLKPKNIICSFCNRPFLVYEGISIKIEDQPCPLCNMTKSGKKWDSEKKCLVEKKII